MSTDLMVPGALDLADLRDPQSSALLVYYLGVRDLGIGNGHGVPARQVTVDETTGVVVEEESDKDYIARVWPGLPREIKGRAVRAGLQRAAFYRDALADGIQLVVYRARHQGWWVETDANGGDEKAFRQWVKDAVTTEEGSPTEATQLASTILNLEYLRDNEYGGLPEDDEGTVDLEPVFEDRSKYNRWRRVASGLRKLVDAARENPDAEDVRDSIREMIDAVNDETLALDDLDRVGRKSPSMPRVQVIESPIRDDLGRVLFYGAATDAQYAVLRTRTSDIVEWVLQGQAYGVHSHVLAQYRRHAGSGRLWRRIWDGTEGWGPFVEVEEIPEGCPDGAPLEDPDLGVVYTSQWEGC
jgi:hypothetical protein